MMFYSGFFEFDDLPLLRFLCQLFRLFDNIVRHLLVTFHRDWRKNGCAMQRCVVDVSWLTMALISAGFFLEKHWRRWTSASSSSMFWFRKSMGSLVFLRARVGDVEGDIEIG